MGLTHLIGINRLHGTKLFSTLDIKSDYINITMDEGTRKYTAFTTGHGE